MDNSRVPRKERGNSGEEQAATALQAAGLEIIARNYRAILQNGTMLGEIDIIAVEGETVVFVEVKAWSTFGMEDLQYGLDTKKQQKIIKTAKYFLAENRKYSKMSIRFDVVFVNNKAPAGNQITHLASAFTESVL
jgi:putative endonuclease